MIKAEYAGNPLVEWLDKNRLTPNQVSVMAYVDYSVIYAVMRGCVRTLPRTLIEAIDEYGADGDGLRVDQAYQLYREKLRRGLMKANTAA
jgi:hypothetical protein